MFLTVLHGYLSNLLPLPCLYLILIPPLVGGGKQDISNLGRTVAKGPWEMGVSVQYYCKEGLAPNSIK